MPRGDIISASIHIQQEQIQAWKQIPGDTFLLHRPQCDAVGKDERDHAIKMHAQHDYNIMVKTEKGGNAYVSFIGVLERWCFVGVVQPCSTAMPSSSMRVSGAGSLVIVQAKPFAGPGPQNVALFQLRCRTRVLLMEKFSVTD